MKRIFVSAGHSEKDPGAISKGGIKEAELALRLRNRVVAALRAKGHDPLSDGEGTENRPLTEAVKVAKKNAKGINVEIHFNAGPATARGVEALAYAVHKVLCKDLCGAIAKHTGSPLRGDFGWKAPNSGQHHRLAFCEAGGLILEVEFISSAAGLAKYLSNEPLIAESLAEALAAHASS